MGLLDDLEAGYQAGAGTTNAPINAPMPSFSLADLEADYQQSASPSLLSSVGKGIVEAPGTAFEGIKSIPSGISNLLNSIFSPKESLESGNTENVLRGVGSLAAGTAGAGVGASTGATIGLLGGPLAPVTSPLGGLIGAAIGGGAGLLGFNKLNQLTGSDEQTSADQDLAALAENTGQGLTLGAAGGLLKGGANLVANGGKLAEILDRRSIGARQGDFAKSLKSGIDETLPPEGGSGSGGGGGQTTTTLANSIEQVRREGGFDGTRNPVKLLDKNTAALDAIENDLTSILETADTVNISSPIIPKYSISEDWIKTQPASEQAALKSALSEIKQAHNSVLDGTLKGLQTEKRALYGKTYGESGAAKEALSKYVAADLKNAIEAGVDDLVGEGKLSSNVAGSVKALNEKSGVYQDVRPILKREFGKSMVDDPIAKLANLGFTTGGITGTTALGTMLGGPVGTAIGAATGIAGKALTTPTGQALTASALRGGAKVASPIAGLLNKVLTPQALGASVATGDITKKESKALSLAAKVLNKPEIASQLEAPLEEQKSMPTSKKEVLAQINTAFPDNPLLKNVVATESSFNPDAVGPKTKYGTAKGLMQLLDSTGEEWHEKLGLPGKYDPFNVEQNLKIGSAYLNWLTDQFDGDTKLALAGYNYGIGNVRKLQKKYGSSYSDIADYLPDETYNYVKKITSNKTVQV